MNTDLIKAAATLIVSAGVGAVVTNAVKATTPADLKIVNKILVMTGTVIASHAVSDVAAKYTTGQIEEIGKSIKEFKTLLPSKKD